MILACTVAAVILFLCGLMKAVSGYGAMTGVGAMILSVLWAIYLHTPVLDNAINMI